MKHNSDLFCLTGVRNDPREIVGITTFLTLEMIHTLGQVRKTSHENKERLFVKNYSSLKQNSRCVGKDSNMQKI